MESTMTAARKDVKFIAEKTKLTIKEAQSLTEESVDLNLLLNGICAASLEKDDIKLLSFPIYCKIVIYKITADYNFSLSDKAFIADAISTYHPAIKKSIDFKMLGDLKQTSPESASYCLVLSGLHYLKLKTDYFTERHEIFMNEGFRKAERLEVGHKIKELVEMLRRAKTDGWFR